mgnify:CR=1 FL=1
MKTNAYQGGVIQLFLKHVAPAIVAVMISGVYVVTDGMFVGHYLAKEGLAAVAIAYPLFMILPGFGLMLGIGGGALISISRGAQDTEKCSKVLSTTLVLTIAFSVIGFCLLYLVSDSLLLLQSQEPLVLAMGSEYLSVYRNGALWVVASTVLTLLIRNDDSPNIAMWIMILGAVLNIALNYVFLGLLSVGIAGAGYASIIAMIIVCVCCIGYYFSSYRSESLTLSKIQYETKLALDILLTGSSVLAMYLYSGFVMAIHNKLFAEYGNTTSLGAFSIVGYLMALYYMLAEGVANGVQPLFSYFYGEKNSVKNKKMVVFSLSIVVSLGLIYYFLLNVFSEYFIHMFSIEVGVIEKARIGLIYHVSAMFLEGFIVIASVYFAAIQRGGVALVIALSNMLMQLPLLYLLPKVWGEFGIWVALPLSNVVLILFIGPLLYKAVVRKTDRQDLEKGVIGVAPSVNKCA